MPIKPPTKPSDGDEVSIDFFTDVYDESETFINKAIEVTSDFPTGGGTSAQPYGNLPVAQTRHIYKPNFFETPSPRTEAVSSEVYYRKKEFGVENLSFHHPHTGSKTDDAKTNKSDLTGWVPVHNMGATFFVDEDSTPSTILCSFYAYEMGGALSAWGSGVEDNNGNFPGKLEEEWCAEFALWIDGVKSDATTRYLYSSTAWQHMHARKQFSFISHPTFSAGEHHVAVMVLIRSLADSPHPDPSTTDNQVDGLRGHERSDQTPSYNCPGWKHIMVGGRSMVIDIHAL